MLDACAHVSGKFECAGEQAAIRLYYVSWECKADGGEGRENPKHCGGLRPHLQVQASVR